ncbi:MAG: DeoR family transcriptional regulator [Treponema sp.]|nr:DeoR family transcriptional regulator [Treponema sp.]
MDKLIDLLKDGRTRSVNELSEELGTSVSDVKRSLEFLEHSGFIRRVPDECGCKCDEHDGCHSCGGCSGSSCSGCMPEGGFKNRPVMWEVIEE